MLLDQGLVRLVVKANGSSTKALGDDVDNEDDGEDGISCRLITNAKLSSLMLSHPTFGVIFLRDELKSALERVLLLMYFWEFYSMEWLRAL